MAASYRNGELISICFLISVSFCFPRFSLVLGSHLDASSYSEIEKESKNRIPLKGNILDYEGNPDTVLLTEQQLQLVKLEELVKNLTQLVSRLESRFIEAPLRVKSPPSLISPQDETNDAEKLIDDVKLVSKEEALPVEGAGGRAQDRVGLVAKFSTFWLEKFQFVSAVKLGSSPTCVDLLPYRDFEGAIKYFAIGDDKGKVYVFLRSGDVSAEFDTHSEAEDASPVSAMVSYFSVSKNESTIVTGHENGVIVMHRVWEVLNGEEFSLLHVERVERFTVPPEGGGSPINILEAYQIGRRRYILTTNGDGKITVFTEDGAVHGAASPSRRPIVFLKQRLLFLTETGAGSLDLRTMKVKESECEGLNNSIAKNYVFDAMERSKAYGITSEGDLIHALLLGDTMNFKCRIRSKRKMDMAEPFALQAIKGYVLIANRERIAVYNVSSQHYARAGGLRLLFSSGLNEIMPSFLRQLAMNLYDGKGMFIPVITSDYEKLVIVSLGNGYVLVYQSNLPVFKSELNSFLWSKPVLFFVLFLFGAWKFFAKKKEALTSWGPNISCTSTWNGAPVGSGTTGDKPFTESSRNSEIDMRSSGLRGPSRRHTSPSRYPSGGAAGSYRPGADTDSRPSSVGHRFRGSDLNFRGPTVEAGSGVAKRRDNLFVNSQVGDDSN